MASPTQWTWVWVNSGIWWWTGRPGMPRFMGVAKSQTRLSNWTELNWIHVGKDVEEWRPSYIAGNAKRYSHFGKQFSSFLNINLLSDSVIPLLCVGPREMKKSFHFKTKRSAVQSCPTLCDPMDCSTPDFPVHHQLPDLTKTHDHWVNYIIQPSHPLLSPSPPAFYLSQHLGLFKWVRSSHQVAKVLEFQLQHQSFQWTSRTDFL